MPGNYVNDISINGSINKYMPPSINRSLTTIHTPGVNTPPRFFFTCNTIMRAKLERIRIQIKG